MEWDNKNYSTSIFTALVTCLIIILPTSYVKTYAQNVDTLWTKFYAGKNAFDMINSYDGGAIIVGRNSSQVANNEAAYIFKIDNEGNKIWSKEYGDQVSAIKATQTNDGNYAVTGNVVYNPGTPSSSSDCYLLKLDENGDTLWTRHYGGDGSQGSVYINNCLDNGFILVGYNSYIDGQQQDYYVVRTDQFGDTLWTKSFGSSYNDNARGIIQTQDSGFVMLGTTFDNLGVRYISIVKFNQIGEILASKPFQFGTSYDIQRVINCSDGNYLAVGHSFGENTNSDNGLMIKLNEMGDTLWTRNIVIPGIHNSILSVSELGNGNFFLSGIGSSSAQPWVNIFIETNSSGQLLTYKTIQMNSNPLLFGLARINDFEFFASGYFMNEVGENNIIVMKLGKFVAPISFNPQPGIYGTPQNILLSTITDSVIIYYTLDESEPTQSSASYTGPIYLNKSTTIKAKGFREGIPPSEIKTGFYEFKVGPLSFSPAPGNYNNSQLITITTASDSVEIHYTLDGSEPTESSFLYNGSFNLNESKTLKAKAFRDGWTSSNTKTGFYVFQVSPLSINPPGGTYEIPQSIIIQSLTDSVEIRYTIDGTDPTLSSNLYSTPILVEQSLTLKAKGFKNGYTPTNIISTNYTINQQVIHVNISAAPIWYDSDYDGFTIGQLDGSTTTISYGSIISYEWLVDGEVVANNPTTQLTLPGGSQYVTLRVTSDSGLVKQDSVLITVLAAIVQTNGAIRSAIGQLDDNKYFATSLDDQVYRFDSTGTVAWTIQTGGDIQSTTCITSADNIFVGSSDTRLYCFDDLGTPKWDKAMGGVIISSPTIGNDGNVYVGVSTGRLFAVTDLGIILWNYQTGGSINSSPSVGANNDIYFGSDDGKVYSLNPAGNLNWSFTTSGPIKSSPAISNDGTIVFGSNDGKIYKLNENGQEVWQFNAGGNITSSPVIGSNGRIYFGSTNGNVYALTNSGSMLWEYNAGSPVKGSPALTSQENILIGCDDGRLLSLSFNGVLDWYLKTGAEIIAPTLITQSGLVYIGSNDGRIYILKISTSSGKKNVANLVLEWPTFKGNNRRTGNKLEVMTSITDKNEFVITDYQLLQNFPNPFNPSTSISFSIPGRTNVSLKVYDLLGEEVAELVKGETEVGAYQINFDASNLPSGIYFYRLQAGKFIETKKMILLK